MDCLCKVVDEAKGSALSAARLAKAEKAFTCLQERLQWNVTQGILMAVIINADGPCNFGDIAEFLRVNTLKVMSFEDDFSKLMDDGYLLRINERRGAYVVFPRALKALRANKPYITPCRKGLNLDEFLKELSDIMVEIRNHSIDEKLSKINKYLEDNAHLSFVKAFRDAKLSDQNGLLFLMAVNERVSSDDCVSRDEMEIFVGECTQTRRNLSGLLNGKSELITKRLLEEAGGDFMGGRSYTLTYEAKEKFLPGYEFESLQDPDVRQGLIHWDSLSDVPLFYNKEESEQMNQLADLMKEENLSGIQQRLKEHGQQTGFAVLLYGPAGTGKTESVKWLSRITQRDIMQADLSSLRDKYVGESEKAVKRLFKTYKKRCEKAERLPILLLNECDGILSKRLDHISSSVDQMNNTMQNIILEELEDFGGILLATSNLTQNMGDEATFRRFLFKVCLRLPNAETRTKIWQSKFKSLSAKDATLLADEFILSGGQIENISRKVLVQEILYNTKPHLEQLRKLSREELALTGKPMHTSIGFL